MPKGKGLYTRKGASGRKMFFRDGKLISEKSYRSSLTRRSTGSRKRNPRPSPRRTNRRKNMARYRKPAMPHPSITGMAAGLGIANYLNQGTAVGAGATLTKGVIGATLNGQLQDAFSDLSKNAVDLATSVNGKKVLSSAIVLATAGGIARKWFPSVKLGGSKMYFRI